MSGWDTIAWRGLSGALAGLGVDEPSDHLQGAFRVGHLAAAGEIGMHALARQAEQTPQIGLGAAFAEVRPELGAKFVPERSVFARA